MYYRCELLIEGYVYPITDDIKNWEDITVSFKRNDYDGVVRTFSDDFEFIRGARNLLLNEYYNNYLNASANIVIYTRNNSWKWTERFRCALNFSTLKDDGYTTTMNAIDNSVASVLKAKKGTEYEFSLDEIKDSLPLYYDGLSMIGQCEWIYTGDSVKKDNINVYTNNFTEEGYTTIPLYIQGSPELPIKGSVEVLDVEKFSFENFSLVTPNFFRLTKQIDVEHANLFNVKYSCNFMFQATWNGKGTCKLKLMNNPVFSEGVIWEKNIKNGYNDISFEIETYLTGILDRNVYLVVELRNGATCEIWQTETDASFQTLSVEYTDRGNPVLMDVVKPQMLLNRLLKSMNGNQDGLTGIIISSGETRLDNALILAAESARKMPGAKIHTSFAKFCDWIKYVFGYVYDIEGNTITFRHRDDYFSDNVVKTIENYTGYSMSLNSSLIYSQVRIGYEKKDYNSVNGKDEFRFTNEYTTGITLTDNKLEMISPYRADAYGIEFLAQKIGEDTTDNESDTDLFFVCAASDGEKYILDRSVPIEGVISPETMFNAMYAPSTFIYSNFSFLGSFISKMTFASSNGNSFVKTALNSENRNVEINKKLFSVAQVEIETSDIDLPKDLTGIVELNHQGRTIKGYYISADYHYTKSKSSKITLVVK